jgi:tetratricopeptide (TPR) repeat protein
MSLLDLLAVLEVGPASLKRRIADGELDQAQDKVFDAMEASDSAERISLAKEALAISPLCADAYVVLAGEAATLATAATLYRRGVEAGAAALGEAAFEEDVGLFWGVLETRPYMRARHGLAHTLWAQGEHDEAVAHYQDMLRLNPGDNQGIRFSLIDALLQLGRDDEAGKLLKQYKDDGSTYWAWSRALLAFRQKGDVVASRKALTRAVEANAHVATYITGRKRLPRTSPDFVRMGSKEEAAAYVQDAGAAWNAAEGAKTWLEAHFAGGGSSSADREQPDRYQAFQADRIDDAVLALLFLGLHDGDRAWKSFDWEVMDRLHRKGFISNPVGKAKSVVFTDEGLDAAKRLHEALFVKGPAPNP